MILHVWTTVIDSEDDEAVGLKRKAICKESSSNSQAEQKG